jgi:hypothetical protein
MSKLLKGAMVVLMIAGFTGCVSTSDIKVESVKSEKVDLKGYKTYQILEESGVATESRVTNLDVNAELQRIINTELGKKGKIPVTNDPDFYVAYLAGTDMDAIKVKVNVIIGISTAEGEVKNLPLEDRKKRLSYTIKKMLSDL